MLARFHHLPPTNQDAQCIAKDFAGGVQPQFTARGDDRRPQDLEATALPQRPGEIDLFSGEILLIKAAGGAEILPRGKKERAGAEAGPEIKRGKNGQKYRRPERNFVGDVDPRATADAALLQCTERTGYVLRNNMGVGIDKEQHVAARLTRAGVSRRRDLSPLDSD